MSWIAALIFFFLTPRYTFVFALAAALALFLLLSTPIDADWRLALDHILGVALSLAIFIVEGSLIVALRKWLDGRKTRAEREATKQVAAMRENQPRS